MSRMKQWTMSVSSAIAASIAMVAILGLTAWLERRARAVKVSHEIVEGLPQ